jgi:signal transduction histidine kinase
MALTRAAPRCGVHHGLGREPFASAPHQHEHWLTEAPGQVIVVDSIRTPTARQADLHLQPFPGSDAALAFAIAHVIRRDGLLDHGLLSNHAIGWEELEPLLEPCAPGWGERVTGVPAAAIEQAAHWYGAGPSLLWIGQGFQRQPRGGNAVRAVAQLAALSGNVYLEAVLAALGLALFRDPYFDPACWANCTDNVFLLRSLPALARGIHVTDRWFTAAAAAALVTICAWRLLKHPHPSRAALLPTSLPAIVFAAATIAQAIALYRMPLEDPANPAFLVIFEIESVAVILLAAGLVWTAARVTAHRRAVARLVSSLGQAPTPGSLEQALARALGDPDLRIAYWLSDSKRYVDATGQPRAEPVATPGRMVTALVEGDRRIAVVSHAAALPELERELGAAVRLGLENERLQAEVLAQLGELRASRARIVETGDAERRRLERDLHDGAQQRLLALSYDIQLARAAAEADADEQAGPLLEHAITEVRAGLADLRDLAHGIYPAILAEAGLGPALATLANGASLPVDIQDAPEGRYPAAVETAAYFLVAEALEDAARRGAGYAAVIAVHQDGRLAVTVEDDGRGRVSPLGRINDRVGALGGILRLEPTTIRAEIPCA